MPELLLFHWFEVPVHGGSGRDLLSPLTGDAAQQESVSCHGFGQRVHLRTAAVTLRHCGRGRTEEEKKRRNPVMTDLVVPESLHLLLIGCLSHFEDQ